MKRIEFIEGEPYCRFDGVMMTDEACKELYGFEGEFDMLDDDTYCINDTIYTDKKFIDLIKILGEVHGEVEEYDEVLSQGRGFASHCAEKSLNNTVVISLKYIDNIQQIKQFKDFKKDYPNINLEKYTEFMDCLDEYYESNKGQ